MMIVICPPESQLVQLKFNVSADGIFSLPVRSFSAHHNIRSDFFPNQVNDSLRPLMCFRSNAL